MSHERWSILSTLGCSIHLLTQTINHEYTVAKPHLNEKSQLLKFKIYCNCINNKIFLFHVPTLSWTHHLCPMGKMIVTHVALFINYILFTKDQSINANHTKQNKKIKSFIWFRTIKCIKRLSWCEATLSVSCFGNGLVFVHPCSHYLYLLLPSGSQWV